MNAPDNLFGLVICGGESSRMGSDKGTLTYYEKPQRYHVYDLLTPLCNKVFLSCNKTQAGSISGHYLVLTDLSEFENIGPIAALLTAFNLYPEHNFLVAGCDYPFLQESDFRNFLSQAGRKCIAAAFYNSQDKYEPLLAYYSSKAGALLREHFNNKEYSLQYFLKKINAEKFIPDDPKVMISVDTPKEYVAAQALIGSVNNL
ncbi:molybdenum cofactor guanylyltransferase [Dyadobacter psychrotolerans]|uniref:Probable molybdenum cofactor guanylyltransferase n=2 Tax=Dyadobacter psychrotolerans TaxID=2541721 RepID=A0A4R5DXP6_9BACT|nr:molybdenum cofactor guanylyltransferase [Dyadobacter psychrotolerans]